MGLKIRKGNSNFRRIQINIRRGIAIAISSKIGRFSCRTGFSSLLPCSNSIVI
jgi:hypothetical protein